MLFTSRDKLVARAASAQDELDKRLPRAVSAIIMNYDLTELYVRHLLGRLLRAQWRHWKCDTEMQKMVGITTLGAVKYGATNWFCAAVRTSFRMRQIVCRNPPAITDTTHIATDANQLWEFLCEEPNSELNRALTPLMDQASLEKVRALFRNGLADYVVRAECAAQARCRRW